MGHAFSKRKKERKKERNRRHAAPSTRRRHDTEGPGDAARHIKNKEAAADHRRARRVAAEEALEPVLRVERSRRTRKTARLEVALDDALTSIKGVRQRGT